MGQMKLITNIFSFFDSDEEAINAEETITLLCHLLLAAIYYCAASMIHMHIINVDTLLRGLPTWDR